jgi:hypothetical protein
LFIGEHLVALQDSSIVQSYGRKVMKGTSSLDNDRKIIDVALFWNSEIGVTGIAFPSPFGLRTASCIRWLIASWHSSVRRPLPYQAT